MGVAPVRFATWDRCRLKSIIAILIGSGLGALLRWAFFASFSGLAPEWRLFVITGFCGQRYCGDAENPRGGVRLMPANSNEL